MRRKADAAPAHLDRRTLSRANRLEGTICRIWPSPQDSVDRVDLVRYAPRPLVRGTARGFRFTGRNTPTADIRTAGSTSERWVWAQIALTRNLTAALGGLGLR